MTRRRLAIVFGSIACVAIAVGLLFVRRPATMVWPTPSKQRAELAAAAATDARSGELERAATVNARFASEAIGAALAAQAAWLTWRDSRTKLFPESATKSIWSCRN